MYKLIVLLAVFAVTGYSAADVIIPKLKDSVGPVVVHATSNSSVPSVDYIVNAVQSLKQAIEIFPDEANTAKLYAALFQTKYPAHNWNVAIGYTTLYLNSSIFVETSVSGGSEKSKKDKKSSGNLYMIFSSD